MKMAMTYEEVVKAIKTLGPEIAADMLVKSHIMIEGLQKELTELKAKLKELNKGENKCLN